MEKPVFDVSQQDGNIFYVLGGARRVLKKANRGDQVEEMTNRVYDAGSYEQALAIIGEYVEFEGEGTEGVSLPHKTKPMRGFVDILTAPLQGKPVVK